MRDGGGGSVTEGRRTLAEEIGADAGGAEVEEGEGAARGLGLAAGGC